MVSRIEINVQLPCVVEQEQELFVSSFPTLDVVSQGYTKDEALDNLVEAAALFFEECFNMGTLDDVLKQCGFSVNRAIEPLPAYANTSPEDYLSVPIPFLASMMNAETRAC